MMKPLKTLILLLALLPFGSLKALPLLDGEAGGTLWYFDTEATAAIDIPSLGLGGADIVSDLGFDSRETAFGLEGRIGDFFQLSLAFMDLEVTANKDLGFVDLDTDFDATFLRPMVGIDLDLIDTLGVGVQAGLQYIDQASTLSVSPFGRFSNDDPALLPIIGGHAFLEIDNLKGQLKLVYSSLDFEDIVARFYDLEASVHFLVGDTFYVGGGYRHMLLEYDEDLLGFEIELSGPMIKAGISW